MRELPISSLKIRSGTVNQCRDLNYNQGLTLTQGFFVKKSKKIALLQNSNINKYSSLLKKA
jgi:hypothetical protein